MTLNLDKSAWKRVTLGDVATASKEKVDPADGSIERYVGGEHMDSDNLKIRRWGLVDDVDLGPAFHRRFHPGQVLYGSRRTYLRKVAVADFDGVCANTTFVVETRDPSMLLQQFLPFIMSSETFHAFAITESKGSVNPYVNWSDVERFEFDLPPLDEQQRIADLLWACEQHQHAVRREVDASRRAAAGLIVDIRRTCTQSVPLNSLATIRNGQSFPKALQGQPTGEIPFFKVSDLDSAGNERVLTNPENWISFDNAKEINAKPLAPGTLVTVRVGAAIRMERRRMVTRPTLVDDNHLVISPKAADSLFLWAILNETRLSGSHNDGVVPSLNQKIVGSVQVPKVSETRAAAVGRSYLRCHTAADALSDELTALQELRSAVLCDVIGRN